VRARRERGGAHGRPGSRVTDTVNGATTNATDDAAKTDDADAAHDASFDQFLRRAGEARAEQREGED
jgi:hypothetical protein